MELQVSKVQSNGFVEVCAKHGDHEPLYWPTPAYSKVKLNDPKGLFNDINAFWATLDMETQENIWNCYVELHSIIRAVSESYYVAQSCRYNIDKMYSYMPMEMIKRWVLIHGNLHVPSDIQDTIEKDSRYTDEGQTYLKSDYINLAIFSLAVRPLLPIWGAYLDLITENQKSKEMEALGLIYGTPLMHWPAEQSVVEKLQMYIDERVRNFTVSMDSIWKGMSSAEVPKMLLAKVIVRRLTIAIIDDPTATSIISSVHWYIRYCLNPTARNRTDKVVDKKIGSRSTEDDDKTSFVDDHKIKLKVVIGDTVAFEETSKMIDLLVKKVDPTVDLNKLKLCLDCIPDVENEVIEVHQKRLAAWVLGRAFSPRAYPHIDKEYIHILIAGAQALLWHWGFINLALLMQVKRYVNTGPTGTSLPFAAKSFPRLQAKSKDELNVAYPHLKPIRAKPNDPDRNATGSYVAIAINNITALIREADWIYLGPKELWAESDQLPGRDIIALPQLIKNEITDLCLHLAKIGSHKQS